MGFVQKIIDYLKGLLNEKEQKDEEAIEDKRVKRKRFCRLAILFFILAIIIIPVLMFTVYAVKMFYRDRKLDTSLVSEIEISDSLSIYRNTSAETETGLNGTIPMTTALATTTTTRAYPVMSTRKRIPMMKLPISSFEIVSYVIELDIGKNSFLIPDTSIIVYELRIKSSTKSIQLRCVIMKLTDISMRYSKGADIEIEHSYDDNAQLLTIKPLQPMNEGNVTLMVIYRPALDAFERFSFPCGSKTCAVYVNHQLHLLAPHFDYMTQYKWTITVDHPPDVTVLTNNKYMINATTVTSSMSPETSPLLPSELFIVLIENFVSHPSGTQVKCRMPSGTKVDEVKDLVQTFEKSLQSKTKPSISPDEMFFIVVVPEMENYYFYGRNVALIGTNLLNGNMENKMDFVWRFIFRTVIYKKAPSSDRNPTWIYEQSAFFLSTNIKSNNTDIWKKHLYEVALDNDRSGGSLNQSIAYEDEYRYFDKSENFAKMSTMLGMITSLGNKTSEYTLANLYDERVDSTSVLFFFMDAEMKLEDGQILNTDRVTSCYVDSPVTPRIHISRTNVSHVAIERSKHQSDRCVMHLGFVRGQNNTNTEHVKLSDKVEKVEVEAKFPILLSGDSPFPAYGYTMDQKEFDLLFEPGVLNSYDHKSLIMLTINSFRAAFEGKLKYVSLQRLLSSVLLLKAVTVDEAVDLWIWTVRQSRNNSLIGLTKSIVASVLNTTGNAISVFKYISDRFAKSVKHLPLFEIEKATFLVRVCGEMCQQLAGRDYYESYKCATRAKNCSYDPFLLEVFVCLKVIVEGDAYYDKFAQLYAKCSGKPCRMPVLRGMMCTMKEEDLQNWIKETTKLNTTDMSNRQIVRGIFKGLASNEVSQPLLFPYLMDNWHLLHTIYAKTPALLGDIIDILASTINTREQLEELKQFVAYHGENLSMYREFKDQVVRSEMAVKWNRENSEEFRRIFV